MDRESKDDGGCHESGSDHDLDIVDDSTAASHEVGLTESESQHQNVVGRHFPGKLPAAYEHYNDDQAEEHEYIGESYVVKHELSDALIHQRDQSNERCEQKLEGQDSIHLPNETESVLIVPLTRHLEVRRHVVVAVGSRLLLSRIRASLGWVHSYLTLIL